MADTQSACADSSAQRIRELNDDFRRTFVGGEVVISNGVAALSAEITAAAIDRVKAFDTFTAEYQCLGDRGSFDIDCITFLWGIDYYDTPRTFGSFGAKDPADPSKTDRVLTIMLASEY